MTVQDYVEELNRRYKSGYSREHSYRGDLQTLLESILPDILVTNEPKRSEVGAPDYILTKKNIPVGYVEAKDIADPDLSGKKKNKEQFNRYKGGLDNAIYTDYLDFHFYNFDEFITSIRIAEVVDGEIKGKPEKYDQFRDLIRDFGTHVGQTIRSANKLSKMMAGKARLLSDVIENALNADQEEIDKGNAQANNTLREQLSAFQNILIHDIDAKEFADIYAQTIAYGMFAARLHDPTLDTFSRHEASELIPKTNPFLRRLFGYIAGPDIDERIVWIVDGLADIFRATDVEGLLKNFGKATKQQDPIIHFYETFLAEYDPSLRKSRGVWYTPEPVVNFIVRAVDDILKDEFGLKDGLADTSKTTVKVNTDVPDKRSSTGYKQEEREVHKVQILDPATGTGTFLAEVIKQIHSRFEGQQGIWKQYVEEHLIPRLNGFEILMASYAMAHLKLDLLLRETGVEPSGSERFRIYLTNSLEEHHPDTGTLFASWLSQEANEANHIKRDTPVMVVLGNPPYSGISSNMGEWISNLIEDYKYVDGEHFGERKHWLHDDYVKFIRYGQHLIDKNSDGVLAFINNHSFIDNPTFRGMRWNLLKSFDKIYIIDLHGNAMKKETTPEGEKDENVFDIQAGVSINIFVKSNEASSNSIASVFQKDVYGKREIKYEKLNKSSFKEIQFDELKLSSPYYFFTKKNETGRMEYENGIILNKLFPNNVTGIVTMGDSFIIADTKSELKSRLNDFLSTDYSEEELKKKYSLGKNYPKWIIENKDTIKINDEKFVPIDYRPFDTKWTYFDNSLIWRWRYETMYHLLKRDNVGLMTCRQTAIDSWEHVGITNLIADDSRVSNRSRERGYIYPLYLYPEDSTQQTLDGKPERAPNLDKKIVQEIAEKLDLTFTSEKEETEGTLAPIDLLDYIYSVLHSPSYREKYKEFLKIDFPRIPYPEDQDLFWQLVELGGELRQFHLLENITKENFITTYPESGSNIISNRLTKTEPGFIPKDDNESIGKVWINNEQYFGNVPTKAWEFYIGGYQPAEKWLKDRRDRELSIEEIQHYQKIIVALMETDRLMQEIDEVFQA
ncbi:type ISP restriction/modification enzyme [Gracilimonas sp.]|uniref:type ISP restriction/modification enzyme n=1 Tax=Gracilimonas sp. TaxID=1974203 RepID=UPI003D0CA52C